MLVYFLKGFLPWQGYQAKNKQEKYQKILDKKITTPSEILCEDLPFEFSIFLNYAKSLKFDDKPDYFFLKKMFRDLCNREFGDIDYKNPHYEWKSPQLVQKIISEKFLVSQFEKKSKGN